MIEGTVTSGLEAVVRFLVSGRAGQVRDVEAVIDTGYDGPLMLPPRLVDELRLPHLGESQAALADGTVIAFDVFGATVLWDGHPRPTRVDAVGTTPLVGMMLLRDHSLHIDVHQGGQVLIEAA